MESSIGLGQLEVEQRVDQQRDAVADDQSGVAPSPAAIGLQIRMATVGDLVETLRIAV